MPCLIRSLAASSEPVIALSPVQIAAKQRVEAALASGELRLVEVDCVSGTTRSEGQLLGERDRYGFPICSYLCPKTGLIWSSPAFDAESQAVFYRDYYRELYFSQAGATDDFFANQVAEGQGILRYVSPSVSSGRVLEVGCGAGGVLKAFAGAGWSAAGCDFGENYLARGRQEGLDLRHGPSSTLADLAGADLLVARHVLEHTLDPLAELRHWASLVREGGFVFVEVPGTLRALDDYRVVGRYFHLAHTYHFTLKSLTWLAGQCGLELVRGDERLVAVFRRVGTVAPVVGLSDEAALVARYLSKWDSPAMQVWQRVRRPFVRLRKSLAKRFGAGRI